MMKKMTLQFFLMLGAMLIIMAAIPLFFNYPYHDGSHSGPSNVWQLVQMFARDSWASLLAIGLLLLIASGFGLR